ncbi:MAG: serine kinase [Erythrobacter sp.]
MQERDSCVVQAGAVAIGGRAMAILGPPGCGKSSLALALIDRGAQLIGDDGVTLSREEGPDGLRLVAVPPPNIQGLIEIAGIGIVRLPFAEPTPLALVLDLGRMGPRLPETLDMREWMGVAIPVLPFAPNPVAAALRAEHALALHGLPVV